MPSREERLSALRAKNNDTDPANNSPEKTKKSMAPADVNSGVDATQIKTPPKSPKSLAYEVADFGIRVGAVANAGLWSIIATTNIINANKTEEFYNNNFHTNSTPEQIVQKNKIDTDKIHDTMRTCNIARSQKPSNASNIERLPKEQLKFLDRKVIDKIKELTISEAQGRTKNMIPEANNLANNLEPVIAKLIALQQKTGIKLTADNLEDGVKRPNAKLIKIDVFYKMLERNFNIAFAFGVENRYTTFNITDVNELSGGSHASDKNGGRGSKKHASINIAPKDINKSGNYHEILGHLDSDIQSPDANMCLLLTQMQANGATYEEAIELVNELLNYMVPELNQESIELLNKQLDYKVPETIQKNLVSFLKNPVLAYQQLIRKQIFYNNPNSPDYDPNTVPEKLKKFKVDPYQYNTIFINHTDKGIVETAERLKEMNTDNSQIRIQLSNIIKKHTKPNRIPNYLNIASYPEIESVATENLSRFGIGKVSKEQSLLHYNVMLKIAAKTNNGAYLDLEYFRLLGQFNWDPSQENADKMNEYLKQNAKPLIINEVLRVDSKYINNLKEVEKSI
jgi:hypothetical protein